jgi:O-antigen/teichoic acid export membrane protein
VTGSADAPSGRRFGTDVLWVGGGIGVYGLASFAFLALCAQALGEGPGYTALALLFTLLNAVGIGLYLPVEQETSRRVSGLRSRGRATAGAARGPAVYAAGSLLVVALVLLLARRWVQDVLFEGVEGMTVVLASALLGMAVAYLARGVLGGTGRFPRYGVQLALDGGLRIAGVLVLAALDVRSAVAYGAVLAAAPLVSTALALVAAGTLLDRAPAAERVAGSMRALVAASLASQLLANAGPVVAQLLERPGEAATTAQLVNALTVARIPLFLFAAVQAVFLPQLAAYVARHERARFTGALRTAFLLTGAIGAVGIGATALVGPQAVRLLFGPGFDIDRGVIVVLATSAIVFMLVQVVVQALLALGRDGWAIWVWVSGLAGLLLALVVPLALAMRVAVALTAGSAAALVVAALALRHVLRGWHAADPSHLSGHRPGAGAPSEEHTP